MKRLAILVFGLCSIPLSVFAHPHAWIDVQSTIVLSDDGQMQAIEQTWLFDELYSATILEGIAEDYNDTEQALQDYAADVIQNLEPYGYFIRLIVDDQRVALGPITQFTIEKQGPHILLSFAAPLAAPVNVQHSSAYFSVYDPTYYIHMAHPVESPPTLSPNSTPPCRAYITQPTPSVEDFTRAFALDRGATAEDDLGYLFAEKVHIQCPN